MLTLGILRWSVGDAPAAVEHLETVIADEQADALIRADALGFAGLIAMIGGDPGLAGERLAESKALHEANAGAGGLAVTEMRLGRLAGIQGDLDGFDAGARRALALFEELGSAWGIGGALPDIAEVQIARGDPRGAIATCVRAMEVLEDVDAQWHAAAALAVMAQALAVAGRWDVATQVCGIVTEWHEQMGAPIFPIVAASYEFHRALVEQELGAERYRELHEEGRLLPRSPQFIASLVAEPA